MTVIASSSAAPRKSDFLARIAAWLTARPTRRQRRTNVELRAMPIHLQRDLGLEHLIFTERRW